MKKINFFLIVIFLLIITTFKSFASDFENWKIEFKKYDPRVKKHVIYKEEKIK